jgi:hypothetical protein
MGGKLAGAVLVVGALAIALPAAAEPSEAEVKAEFIERFTRFVDWDADAIPADSFVVCTVGENPITPYLEKLVKHRKLRNRPAALRKLAASDDLTVCQIVLIGSNDHKTLRNVLKRTDGRPILTVADAPGAAAAGVIINFYVEDDHVRFEINPRAAKDGGLRVRAKLLKLARVVQGEAH